MQFTRLGNSHLDVSRICLGTAFRAQVDEATGIAAIHRAADLGCNYLDCANIYRRGLSEQIVGKAIRGRRDSFVVSTKVGGEPETGGPAQRGLTRARIVEHVEESLTRLGTDHLDCYLCHFPDPDTPLAETLGALSTLVAQGKVRFIGASNFESWRLCDALHVSERLDLPAFVCNQVSYSLLNRRIEDELLPFCRQRNIGITAYATTMIGLLSGRFRRNRPPPPGTSWHRGPYNYRAAMTEAVDRVIATVLDIAERHGRTPSQVAMAWCLRDDVVRSVIIGADTPERVEEDFAAADWLLPPADQAELERASEGQCLVVHKDCPGGYAAGTDGGD